MAILSNDIRVGSASRPTYQWKNEKIALGTPRGIFSVDILGNELTIDTFSFTVSWNVDAPLVYAPYGKDGYLTRDNKLYLLRKPSGYGQNFLKDIAPGTPVFWYVAGSVFAKGYLQNVQRVGKYLYKITCFSGIGLLDAKTHYGGLYSGQSVSTLLTSIIGSSFTYTVDADVGAVAVYGHLPCDTARNNLHRLLFAVGAVLMRDVNGNYQVSFLSNTMTNIPTSRIALGGKTEYTIPADSVEITEHSFFAQNSDELVSLFDNTNGAAVSNQLVLFDEPMHDLTTSGNLTINESSVNHAVVSGVGTLTGKKYTHNSLIIKQGSGNDSVKKVTDNELVSFANSYYVANRVYSYFTSTKQIDAKIMLENEKPGQLLSLRDAFGEPTNAYLSRADVLVTTVKGAQCRLISGFVPGSNGNNFTRRALITANTTWTVPSGVTRVRIVLIGGGQGGQGGYDGADGMDDTTTPGLVGAGQIDGGYNQSYIYYPDGEQPASQGGDPGAAGAKAAFLVSDQVVSAGNTIAIVVGVGGNGGARNGELGEYGTPTTAKSSRFGTISSDDGVATYEGYNDPIGGITYAIDGIAGIKGGDGGLTYPYGEIPPDGEAVVGGYRGEAVETWSGGAGSDGTEWHQGSFTYGWLFMSSMAGAGGGGAANGRNGVNAANARYTYQTEWDDRHQRLWEYYDFYGGNGGNGANAVAPAQPTIYGQGGAGGHGGGGGGNAGGLSLWYWTDSQRPNFTTHAGTRGIGGQGSAGSKGGNGCAIIYY